MIAQLYEFIVVESAVVMLVPYGGNFLWPEETEVDKEDHIKT